MGFRVAVLWRTPPLCSSAQMQQPLSHAQGYGLFAPHTQLPLTRKDHAVERLRWWTICLCRATRGVWEGRAHDGLVDARNTAALALVMARGSYERGRFVFRGTTRGLDADGDMFGGKAAREKKQRALERQQSGAPANKVTRR